ncbi:MAG TPA: chemotaxis protein CheX [Candidatus Sulfotelmatobacter sp.]|nr:chemotaxis protein CheX [Candidatus Sulfotelmatobacter sp.]
MNSGDVLSVSAREDSSYLLELAAREVFQIMMGSRLERAESTPVHASMEFTAMVGLAGSLCGVLSLRCGSDTATLMVKRMLGDNVEDLEQQRWDALGETCNMIAGNFKDKLTGIGYRCLLSVPTVISGGDYRVHPLAGSRSVDVHLLFEDHPVQLLLEVHS